MSHGPAIGDGQWFVFDVNPYPWKVPPFSVGRKSGKHFVVAGRDQGLHTYKEAIREQLEDQGYRPITGAVAAFFWYYRSIEVYRTPQGRRSRNHEADTTNLQKATEDALQDYVLKNDRDVSFVQSWRVEQGTDVTPYVVAYIAPFLGGVPTFPDVVQSRVDEIVNRSNGTIPTTNDYTPPEEIPF